MHWLLLHFLYILSHRTRIVETQFCEAMKRVRSSSAKSKVRGGIRQRRRRRAEEEAAHVENSSHLAILLLSLFAWGEMSPQLLQKIAHAAYKDACRFKEATSSLLDLEKMAGIGCEGMYSNKCYGDLMKVLPFKVHVPAAMPTRLPFRAPLHSLTQGILMPHELFSCIFHYYRDTWNKCILPSSERLQRFWSTNRLHPAMQSSKLQSIDNYSALVVPICFHGDDVPITGVGKGWAQSMTVFSWSSLIGVGTTKDLQYLIYGCFEKLRAVAENQSEDTLGVFFTQLTWSFKWLLEGVWPDCDWSGAKSLDKKCTAMGSNVFPQTVCRA